MQSQTLANSAVRQAIQPPVHEHRDWRHLQRAAIAAHKQLGNVSQATFCALMVPAASIALWICQHAPHLARQTHLHILVAQATEYEALDSGRWLRFIPWLLGRPEMQLELHIVGALGLSESGMPADESESEVRARLDHRFQSCAWAAVKSMHPAELHVGTVRSWSELGPKPTLTGSARTPDLCAVFSPTLSMSYPALLSEDGLLPLLRAGVPLAFFSSSEASQLVDVYILAAAGIELEEPDAWPNPWALPALPASKREGAFAKMAWSAAASHVAMGAYPDQGLMEELGAVLAYIDVGAETERFEQDAVLSLGEPLRAAPLKEAGADSESASILMRLPHDMAVDSRNGHIYQLQDSLALLLDVKPVPMSIMGAFPGNEHLLLRAIWATAVHRDHVAPYVQDVHAALVSQFSELEQAASGMPCVR